MGPQHQQNQQQDQQGQKSPHWMNEPDIGSGEKSAAQRKVEREQQALGEERRRSDSAGADTGDGAADNSGGDTLQDGDHLARVATRAMDDGTYEAQVFVRLTREPEVAETYIPVGTFPTEEAARAAAEERARRALREQEF